MKYIQKILCLLLVFFLVISCKTIGKRKIKEELQKIEEPKMTQAELDDALFAKLEVYLTSEDVSSFSSIIEETLPKDLKRVLDRKNKVGRTLLHRAVLLENVELVKLLLDAKVNEKIKDDYKKTAKDYAGQARSEAIKDLFGLVKKEIVEVEKEEKGGSLSSVPVTIDSFVYSYDVMLGSTSSKFLKAVKNQDYNAVLALLNTNQNINETDSLGNNALFYALLNGDTAILKLLLAHRINVDRANNAGKLPFLYAVDKADINVIKAFLDSGVNIDAQDSQGFCAVLIAVYRKYLSTLQSLYRQNADLSVRDGRGNTLLHIAVQNEDYNIVSFLLKKDCDAYAPNNDDVTPVQMMKLSKNSNLRELGKRLAKRYEE
ncbi:MAG: ankyrin repeat domain-containing protein [Treponema sp.]